MLDMPGVDEFYIQEPYLEGAEVFGSSKRSLDLLLGTVE